MPQSGLRRRSSSLLPVQVTVGWRHDEEPRVCVQGPQGGLGGITALGGSAWYRDNPANNHRCIR